MTKSRVISTSLLIWTWTAPCVTPFKLRSYQPSSNTYPSGQSFTGITTSPRFSLVIMSASYTATLIARRLGSPLTPIQVMRSFHVGSRVFLIVFVFPPCLGSTAFPVSASTSSTMANGSLVPPRSAAIKSRAPIMTKSRVSFVRAVTFFFGVSLSSMHPSTSIWASACPSAAASLSVLIISSISNFSVSLGEFHEASPFLTCPSIAE